MLDSTQTVALAAAVLFAGYAVQRRVRALDRFNIPAPVVGGFLFALLATALRPAGTTIALDTALQTPLMIAFFTTIGLGASFALVRKGGPQVFIFWGLASIVAVLQNAVGVGIAKALGVNPLIGLVVGSITMCGGHGTGAAFGKLLEEDYAFPGAVTFAMAAATFGLVSGGIIGGPVGTRLITRFGLSSPEPLSAHAAWASRVPSASGSAAPLPGPPESEPLTAYTFTKTLAVVLVAMSGGSILSEWLAQYIALPAYVGAMICAAVIRNVGDATNLVRIDARAVDDLGTIALSLFLSMALMSMRLWELSGLALPMLLILVAQVALMAAFARYVTFWALGRDYEAAVMAAGHCGFGLGATPNAVANMRSLVERYGAAPRAFLVLPLVGAFTIDFTNALIITAYLNVMR